MAIPKITLKPTEVGCDLDGTLAVHTSGSGPGVIGEPIPEVVAQVRAALEIGVRVYIHTARVSERWPDREQQRQMVVAWCREHIGVELEVTADKRASTTEFWDDRAVRVLHNAGIALGTSDSVWAMARDHRAYRDEQFGLPRRSSKMQTSAPGKHQNGWCTWCTPDAAGVMPLHPVNCVTIVFGGRSYTVRACEQHFREFQEDAAAISWREP